MKPVLTARRVWIARVLAVVADAVQIALVPLFFTGAAGIADAVLDLAVGAALVALVGWHVAFLPGFVTEMIPIVNLAPTWTLAVLWATRHAGVSGREIPPPPQ